MDIKTYVFDKAKEAKEGAEILGKALSKKKDLVLLKMADALRGKSKMLISENQKDTKYAEKKGLSKALIDRLTLNEKRIGEMAQGLIEVSALPDPVGEITKMWQRPNGMTVGRMRVPIGVIGIIYESRPNVTADVTGLCLKAGNAIILRGGSEAINSNKAIVTFLKDVVKQQG